MHKISVRPPSVALVVACLALGIALGGTGSAAVLNVPDGSVTTAKIKNGAVTTAKAEERRRHGRQACGQCRDVGSGQERHPAQGRLQVRAASGRSSRTRRAAGRAWPERSARSERARARRRIDVFELREFEERRRHLPFGEEGHRRRGAGDRAAEPTRFPSTRTSRTRLATSGTRRRSRSCRPGSPGSFSRTPCARM